MARVVNPPPCPFPLLRLSVEGAAVITRYAGPIYGCTTVLATLLVDVLTFASTPD
ncbi:hypothetical protein [Streptomyces abyssalis]|uniref:hypothetical protein n=1 Tax=Streptomyces abyssalis TaxID=933944 RepID=UPI001495A6CB|nr:hypothetical protein [Streptomyces abyssalis]